MPTIHLFEDDMCVDLHPFHAVEGVQGIRFGGFLQSERWALIERSLPLKEGGPDQIHVNARWVPGPDAVALLAALEPDTAFAQGNVLLAQTSSGGCDNVREIPSDAPQRLLHNANQLFADLGAQIESDRHTLQAAWNLTPMGNQVPTLVFGPPEDVLISSSASIKAATIDTESGPVIIGPNATIEAGAHLKGPLIIGSGATVRMAARISGPTVIGDACKVGGEISNVNFQGWANKAHDGFLGNSVIGRWCNLGAGTESSNLKNTYGEVRQWNERTQALVGTGRQFCGLLMGDHSKCGIGTTFNTGTVVDPACVIFDAGFPPKHLPAFSWFNARTQEMLTQDIDRMLSTAQQVMARRGHTLTDAQRDRLSQLHAARLQRG